MKFTCIECNATLTIRFNQGIYQEPQRCNTHECKGKKFQSEKSSTKSLFYQRIKVQEVDDSEQVSGRVPRALECELRGSLVSSVINGDIVIINGTLKTEVSEQKQGIITSKKMQGIQQSYVEVNSIINNKSDNKIVRGQQTEDEFTEEDYNFIKELSQLHNIFPLLTKSLCPTIYGHELLKAGILLAILGGSQIQENDPDSLESNQKQDENKSFFRSDSHVLLIGDPGLGKSQILKFIAQVTPRSMYICGSASSTAGLTVSVSKDPSTGENTLEAGALILSDQGVCCIDEFDKMQDQHQALLEAMEQQTVSLAKSGVMCSLQSRASIIASANPIGGHYNKQKAIKDNIKISNAILSRFDLIFFMLDRPDPNRDEKLSKHILKLHNKQQVQQQSGWFQLLNPNLQQNEPQDQKSFKSFGELISHECQQINMNQILPPDQMRKYISYAKKNTQPTLSQSAAKVIKDFYLTLRQNSQNVSAIPITTRQLESMIRLAQARAKVELRNEVTEQDAQDVVDIIQESLFDSLEDLNYDDKSHNIKIGGLKTFGNQETNNVAALSKPKQTKIFIDKVQEEYQNRNSDLFDMQELTLIAKRLGLNVGSFQTYIQELTEGKNYFIYKGNKVYQLIEK